MGVVVIAIIVVGLVAGIDAARRGAFQTVHAPIVLDVGDILFVLFVIGVVVFVIGLFGRDDNKLKRLKERHENLSYAENKERISMLYKAMSAPTPEAEKFYMEQHEMLTHAHEKAWDGRVKKIVDIEQPLTDKELKKYGLYPYDD